MFFPHLDPPVICLTEKRPRLNDRLHRFSKQSRHSEEDFQPEMGNKMTAAVAGKQDWTGFRSTGVMGDKHRAHQEKAMAQWTPRMMETN